MLIKKTYNFSDNNYKLISEQLKYVASKYESLVKFNFHEKTWGVVWGGSGSGAGAGAGAGGGSIIMNYRVRK